MRSVIRAAVICIAVLLLGVAYLQSLPVDIVAIGAAVRQDDFLYTVTHVDKHLANGIVSYFVSIRVDNHAKVVDYRWSDESVYVTDSAGWQYSAVEADRSVARARPAIAAGSSAEYAISFEVPVTAEHPMLRYWNGIMMGDMFDGAAYGRAAVAL